MVDGRERALNFVSHYDYLLKITNEEFDKRGSDLPVAPLLRFELLHPIFT